MAYVEVHCEGHTAASNITYKMEPSLLFHLRGAARIPLCSATLGQLQCDGLACRSGRESACCFWLNDTHKRMQDEESTRPAVLKVVHTLVVRRCLHARYSAVSSRTRSLVPGVSQLSIIYRAKDQNCCCAAAAAVMLKCNACSMRCVKWQVHSSVRRSCPVLVLVVNAVSK